VAKRKIKAKGQSDSEYLLKLAIYLIVGSLWVKIAVNPEVQISLPFGLAIGLVLASHEHFKVDRKIEYAVLLVAMLIGFWLPIGVFVSL
jgi:hypothetical protein